jgi:uncharacterized protein YprB with RNaseH-like and TPR domain
VITVACPRCGGTDIVRAGSIIMAGGRAQRFLCKTCAKRFHIAPPRPLREGFLDIEASQLNAAFGQLLSWALKLYGGPLLSDVIKARTEKEERRILQSLLKALERVDVIYTYYGAKFDVPFIRSRCLYHGLTFPAYLELYHRDVYYLARRCLRLHSTRLAAVAEFLGIRGKTPVAPKVWVAAGFGDRKALRYIHAHNRADVRVLEKVYEVLKPFARPTWRSA